MDARRIQRWWRKRTSMKDLTKVFTYINENLTPDDLQEIADKCNAITNACKGDGAGLAGGGLIDMLICRFFTKKLTKYSECHKGESDMTICDVPLSQKKITGASDLALDWSKNETESIREHFSCHIIIINLKTSQWWKKTPKNPSSHLKILYNDMIPSGIYLVDKKFCKFYITLSSNNKTNTLIKKEFVYIMLKRSIALNLFIDLPDPNKDRLFDILNAFS
jgi:hypothetical protein